MKKLGAFWSKWNMDRLLAILSAWNVLILFLAREFLAMMSVPVLLLLLLSLDLPMDSVYFVTAFILMKKREKRQRQLAEAVRAARERAEHDRAAQAAPEQPPAEEKKRLVSGVQSPYSAEEREALERYYEEAFGPIRRIFYDADNREPRIDITVSEPTEDRRFYTLSTVGMGSRAMEVPPHLAEKNRSFAELTILLPEDWDLMNDSWPFRVLRETARRPFQEASFIEAGDAYRGPMMENSGFCGVLVSRAIVRENSATRVLLSSGKLVSMFLLLPIFREEWDYIMERRSSVPLWRRYLVQNKGFVVDPGRSGCVGDSWLEEDILPFSWEESRDGKTWYLTLEELSWQADVFERANREADGLSWMHAAQAFLSRSRAEYAERIEFDCDRGSFVASSEDRKALRTFALGFRDLCADRAALEELLKRERE